MESINLKYKNSVIYLLGKIYFVKKSEYYSGRELEILQRQRFEKLVKYAMRNSKFYREFYHDYNIKEENVGNKALTEFPKINKSILMENFNSVLTKNDINFKEVENFLLKEDNVGKLYKGKYQLVHTSGSSGKIGIFVYDQEAWQTLKALVMTRVNNDSVFHLKKQDLTFIGATTGHYAGISLANSAPRLFFRFNPVDINRPIEEIIEKVNMTNPDTLTGYSSGIYMLSKLQKEGKIKISPHKLICSADPLTEGMKEEICEAFGVAPITFYASSESICMAAQSDGKDEIHLFNDFHIFELFDQKGNYSKDGEPGKLVLTNLYNYIQPLIRYDMNDELIIGKNKKTSEDTKNKWKFPVLEQISGRSEEFLWLKKQNDEMDYIHPAALEGYYVPGLEKFQIVQESESSFNILAVINTAVYAKDSILSAMREKMNEILEQKGFSNYVIFKITETEFIPNNEKTGKFKLVIPLKKI